MLGHTRIFSTVHRYSVQEEPKAKEDPNHYQKNRKPKKSNDWVVSGWEFGFSAAKPLGPKP